MTGSPARGSTLREGPCAGDEDIHASEQQRVTSRRPRRSSPAPRLALGTGGAGTHTRNFPVMTGKTRTAQAAGRRSAPGERLVGDSAGDEDRRARLSAPPPDRPTTSSVRIPARSAHGHRETGEPRGQTITAGQTLAADAGSGRCAADGATWVRADSDRLRVVASLAAVDREVRAKKRPPRWGGGHRGRRRDGGTFPTVGVEGHRAPGRVNGPSCSSCRRNDVAAALTARGCPRPVRPGWRTDAAGRTGPRGRPRRSPVRAAAAPR